MIWVKKHKLPAMKAIQFNGYSCIELEELWQALHQTFHSAQDYYINLYLIDKIPLRPLSEWLPSFKVEFTNIIEKCNSMSTLGSDHVSWNYLKILMTDNKYITNLVNIANDCINLGYWLLLFKKLTLIIILKSNKLVYDSPKAFYPIVLLNTIRKFIEKVISERLQAYLIISNFIYSNQLGRLKHCLTIDLGLYITYLI